MFGNKGLQLRVEKLEKELEVIRKAYKGLCDNVIGLCNVIDILQSDMEDTAAEVVVCSGCGCLVDPGYAVQGESEIILVDGEERIQENHYCRACYYPMRDIDEGCDCCCEPGCTEPREEETPHPAPPEAKKKK